MVWFLVILKIKYLMGYQLKQKGFVFMVYWLWNLKKHSKRLFNLFIP